MTRPDSADTRPTARAQDAETASEGPLAEVHAEFLRLIEEGRGSDIDEFCARQPKELRSELRAMCLDALFLQHHLPEDADATPRDVKELDDFRLLREVGRGGMGVVYLARQRSLEREVAIKVLLPHLTRTERQVERFRREARAAARLRHPNIVPIHSIGEDGGTHYFAMEYIAGHSLARELRAQEESRTSNVTEHCILPPFGSRNYITRVVELCAEVSDALAHGHDLKVVHRDIKPANILLDPGGHAHVVDFGLAKDEAEQSISRSGELAGTVRYMSPEQTLAKRVPMDHRTDIFSLGVVLYELLTLERPFEGDTTNDILYQVSFREPRALRKVNPRVPRDLEIVCGKALSKSPDDRYATAGDLAEDLRRFLRHESILARPPSILQRARIFGRAHRPLVATVLFAAVAVALGWVWGRWDTWSLRKRYAVWQSAMEAAGAPAIQPLSMTVLAGGGASVTIHVVDRATTQPLSGLVIGKTPIRAFPVDVAGLYRVVVRDGRGFAEMTRYLAPGSGDTLLEPVIRPTAEVTGQGMVQFPGGPFRFERREGDEPPWLYDGEIQLEPYWIDEAEVSNREYREFVLATGHAWPQYWNADNYDPAWDDLPVVGVTWYDAVAYAEWAGKRLPTQAEWVRAARGQEGRLYPWGNDPRAEEKLANLWGTNDWGDTSQLFSSYLQGVHPVRGDPQARTPEGLYHMLGNVTEWTGSIEYEIAPGGAVTFPMMRVLRGAAWWTSSAEADFRYQAWSPAAFAQNHYGFRCAKSAEP